MKIPLNLVLEACLQHTYCKDWKTLKTLLKTNIKLFLETVEIKAVEQSVQFLRYLRTIDEHIMFLRNTGFSNFDTDKYNHGIYYIIAKV